MKLAREFHEHPLPDSMMAELFETTFNALLRTHASAAASASAERVVPEGVLAQLDLLEEVTEALTSVDPATLPGSVAAEMSRRLHAANERLAAERLGCIGRVEVEGSWAVETMHGFTTYMQAREELSKRAADRDVGAARKLRDHLPATAVAARAGLVGDEHVAIMVRATGTQVLRAKLAAPLVGDARDLGTHPDPTLDPAAQADPALASESAAAAAEVGPTGEEALLELARVWDVDEFNGLIKRFTVSGDPVAQEKAFKDAVEKEYLQISPTLGGASISGFLTTEHAYEVNAALRAIVGVPPAGDHAGDIDPENNADGLRMCDLRKIDGLLTMSRLVLDGGLAGKGANVRPHLSVLVSWEKFTELFGNVSSGDSSGDCDCDGDVSDRAGCCDGADCSCDGADGDSESDGCDCTRPLTTGPLATGSLATGAPAPDDVSCQDWSPDDLATRLRAGHPTWEDGTGPIPDAVLRRIACDSEITRIIFGPDSQILNIGRTKRTFTKAHRRAIVARDQHCVWPGCTAPPHVCEVHHAVRHWADDGETAPSNGALLCRHHHHRVDGENMAMTYDNGWTIHRPDTYQPDGYQAGGYGPGDYAT